MTSQLQAQRSNWGVIPDDAKRLLARAGEADVKAKLIENTQNAVERGAFGSPTFFVGNEMFFGKEQLREVEEAVLGK